jgi:hypothetical protein
MMNYGGLAKFVEGSGFVRVPEMTWINPEATVALNEVIGEDENLVKRYPLDIAKHQNRFFTEVYPKDFGGPYVYLYGQGPYRMTGVYLARIKKEAIEDFSALEYFIGLKNGKPFFEKAPKALSALAPVLSDCCGEFSLLHLQEGDRYLLFGTRLEEGSDKKREVVSYVSASPEGPFASPVVLIASDDPRLRNCVAYAPLADESFFDPESRRLSLILSRWLPCYSPITLSVKLEDLS